MTPNNHLPDVGKKGHDRGSTLGLFVVGTAVCGALLAGILYLFNDGFRARTLSVVRQIQRWTPEDIRQDPSRYLLSVADRTKAVQERLQEERNLLELLNDRYRRMREDADSRLLVVTRPLDELERLYREAEGTDRWPEVVGQLLRDRDWVQEQIERLQGQKIEQLSHIEEVDAEASPWEIRLLQVLETMKDCKEQLARIESLQTLLREQDLTDGLLAQLVHMERVIEMADATAVALEGGFAPAPAMGPEKELEDVEQVAFDAVPKR